MDHRGPYTRSNVAVALQLHSHSAGGYGVAALSQEGHNHPLGVTSASVMMATHCPSTAKAVGWGKRPF